MPKPFEPDYHYALTRRRIIGLGERRVRKNYYPQLQQRLEELKRSELRYRALFENSPISLWEEDFSRLKSHFDQLKKDGVEDFSRYFSDHPEEITRCIRMVRIVDVNRSTLALYEAVSKKELLGSIHRILPQTAQSVLKTELVAMAQAGRFEIECINRTLKGNDRHLLIKSSIPPGYENSWERVFISVYDLTERIEAEKEKKDLGRQLRQAQKMEAVGTLAGGIAHDFNNILSAVIGFTEMAMEDAPPDSALTHNMEQVLQAGLRAKHLVQQILAFSRQQEAERQTLKIGPIIKEVLKLIRASLPSITARESGLCPGRWIVEMSASIFCGASPMQSTSRSCRTRSRPYRFESPRISRGCAGVSVTVSVGVSVGVLVGVHEGSTSGRSQVRTERCST